MAAHARKAAPNVKNSTVDAYVFDRHQRSRFSSPCSGGFCGEATNDEVSKLLRDLYIEDNFDLEGLREIGFLSTKRADKGKPNYVRSLKDYDAIERRIVTFFKLRNLYEWDELAPENWKNREKPNPVVPAAEWLDGEGRKTVQPN